MPSQAANTPSASSTTTPTLVAKYPDAFEWTDNTPLTGDSISCDFHVFAYGQDDRTTGELELNLEAASGNTPVTFYGLTTGNPSLKGNNGQGSVAIVKDTPEELVIIDRNSTGNVFTYTISRTHRTAIYTKAYYILGHPLGLLAVGRCY